MAEAHSHQLVGLTRSGVHLFADEDGLHISFHVPTMRVMLRKARNTVRRTKNSVSSMFYPMGPSGFVVIPAVLSGAVLTADPSSFLRSGPFANHVWNVATKLPLFDKIPDRKLQIFVCAAYVGTAGAVALLTFERIVLRTLLRYHGFLFEDGRKTKVSLTTKLWGLIVKGVQLHQAGLYSWQGCLPRLPVPPLRKTADRYIESMKPLLDNEELETLKREADDFVSGQGKVLQRFLYLKSWLFPNYVTDWWEKYCYLRGRSPIMINSNYYITDVARGPPTNNQCARGGHVAHHMMMFKRRLDLEEPLDQPQITPPLCMRQYERMFSTTRVPGVECDSIVHLEPHESTHIAVLRKGYWFVFEALHGSGRYLDPHEIEKQLSACVSIADEQKPPKRPQELQIAALTGWDRTKWAEARALIRTEDSRHAIDLIESAIVVIVLEDEIPANRDAYCKAGLAGNGHNRWFDKSVSLIVYPDGVVEANCEHAWADAPIVGHMFEISILMGMPEMGGKFDDQGRNLPTESNRNLQRPVMLSFASVPDAVCDAVSTALVDNRRLIDDTDLRLIEHNDYGKKFITSNGVSPDGYVQMAMQLAYYKTSHKPCQTYESSLTRFYRLGRTETVRPCTTKSVAFTRAMVGESGPMSNDEKFALLETAVETHIDNAKHAMIGEGIDRHLFALYIVSVGLDKKVPFLQNALSRPWTLSTSQQPQHQSTLVQRRNPQHQNLWCPGGGFGPVHDDGYGVSYMVLDDRLFFHVSSKNSSDASQPELFVKNLLESLAEMKSLVSEVRARQKQQKNSAK